MRKIIAMSSLLLCVVFLSGCGQQQLNQAQSSSVVDNVVTSFTCGSQIKDANDIAYGTVLAKDGKCWLDRNLGATRVATSPSDKDAYGWYFQWGRSADGHQIPTSETTETLSKIDNPGNRFILSKASNWKENDNNELWQGKDGDNSPCPSGWKVPSEGDWNSVVEAEKITDANTGFSSSLKLVVAGYREGISYGGKPDGLLHDQGEIGYYWSRAIHGHHAYGLYIDEKKASASREDNRAQGFTVRCIKN